MFTRAPSFIPTFQRRERLRLGTIVSTFLLLLLAPPAALPAACTGPKPLEARIHAHPDADGYIALGNWFGENRNSLCAVEAFQTAVKLQPGSAPASYLLGLSLYTAGRFKEAVAPLRQSVKLDPEQDKTHLLLGATFASLGRDKEALTEWQAAVKLDPTSKMALDGLAKAYTALGDYQSVISSLGSTELDENLTYDLATAYGMAGKYDEAAQILNDGLKSYPDSNILTKTLVTIEVKQLKYQQASVLAEKFAGRNPDDIEAQRIYLRVLVLNGENETATPLAAKLLSQAPHDADILYLNGILERQAGDFQAARTHLEEAVARNPNHYNSHYNLGVALEHLQDPAGAKVQFEKAIELGAQEPEIRFELSKVLRTLGQTRAAQEELKLYQTELKNKSDRTLAAQKSTQADLAAKAGDNRKAADLYREASAAMPENANLAFRLAHALANLGDIAGERSALEQAVQADPNYFQAQYQLGYLETSQNDNAAAELHFRLAVKASPNFTQGWVALAATLASESKVKEAQEAAEAALKLDPANADALQLKQSLAEPQAHR